MARISPVTMPAALLFNAILVGLISDRVDAGGPPVVIEEAHLTASDADANDYFGWDLGMSGNTVVVGSIFEDGPGGLSQGAAYVFVRNGLSWTQQAKLRAVDGEESDVFGESVAIDGDTIVVGSIFDDVGVTIRCGSAYVYVRSGTTWTQQAHLFASDFAADARFGESVAIDGDTLVVGANWVNLPGGGIRHGAAYVFVRNGGTWSEQDKLTASNAATNDEFGTEVEIQGDTIVTQAYRHDGPAGEDQGAIYVFERIGSSWSQSAMLYPSAAHAFGYFGGVAIDGDTLVGTMANYDGPAGGNQGAAFVFERNGASWVEQAIITADDAAPETYLGASAVDIEGDMLVVGQWPGDGPLAPDQGAAYLFTRTDGVWSQLARLTASDGSSQDDFGARAVIEGDRVVVGATFDDVTAYDQGSAYAFRIDPTPPDCCRGDMNESGQVEIADAAAFMQVLLALDGTEAELCAADMDGNGLPNSRDIQVFVDRLLSGGACSCPSITDHPQDEAVCAGQSASFDVTVQGAVLGYQWRKGGVNLFDGGNVAGATTATLTINPAGAGDSGNYDVIVSTNCGPFTSTTATLTAANGPVITQQPADAFTCEFEGAGFFVGATGVGTLSYQWRKNGTPLNNGGNVSGADTATLTISPAFFPGDVGNYDCIVTDDCGSETSDAATLNIIGCG